MTFEEWQEDSGEQADVGTRRKMRLAYEAGQADAMEGLALKLFNICLSREEAARAVRRVCWEEEGE